MASTSTRSLAYVWHQHELECFIPVPGVPQSPTEMDVYVLTSAFLVFTPRYPLLFSESFFILSTMNIVVHETAIFVWALTWWWGCYSARFICLEFICDVLARVPIANFKGCLHMLNIIKKDLSILYLSHWLLHLAMFTGSLTLPSLRRGACWQNSLGRWLWFCLLKCHLDWVMHF